MSCQWHPTILAAPAGWIAADSDIYPGPGCYEWAKNTNTRFGGCWDPENVAPLWAGEPRGRFRFHGQAAPARTHGGLPTQPPIEARLGRSIPDPSEASGDVHYWDVQPRLFHVRNQSGETVTAEFPSVRCGLFSQTILDTETLIFGPFWGRKSTVDLWVFGPNPGPCGVRTVPSGVDVQITETSLSDPGESFANWGCEDPAVVPA